MIMAWDLIENGIWAGRMISWIIWEKIQFSEVAYMMSSTFSMLYAYSEKFLLSFLMIK